MQQSGGHDDHPPLDGPFGFVVIDKPAGLTSHSCVSRLRRCYGLKRVGHGGTLDPAVTGVLPIALGPATRLLPYLPGDKTYRGVIQLGSVTSSDDLEGELLRQAPWPDLQPEELESRPLPRSVARSSNALPRYRPFMWTANGPMPAPGEGSRWTCRRGR